MVTKVVEEWGGIDVLINNAGRGQACKGNAHTLETSDLQSLLDLNVISVHMVTSAVLQNASPSRMLNISSRAGKIGIPGMSFYVASKFALEGYSAALAEELRGKCHVNTISPGMVDTKSFPKAPGQPGVRSAESIRDALLMLLTENYTGYYLHVDELDQVRTQGLADSAALKLINEPKFLPT
jgi:NAD(P)-dependent dehydrogenase (short-subunit alcohol dehydrogenase family)